MTDTDAVLHMLHNASATQADIAFALDIPIRSVQAAIVDLRMAGHPVVTDGEGVRLARDAEECLRCADSLLHRAVTQWRTARALRATGRRMRDQEAAAQRLTLWEAIA